MSFQYQVIICVCAIAREQLSILMLFSLPTSDTYTHTRTHKHVMHPVSSLLNRSYQSFLLSTRCRSLRESGGARRFLPGFEIHAAKILCRIQRVGCHCCSLPFVKPHRTHLVLVQLSWFSGWLYVNHCGCGRSGLLIRPRLAYYRLCEFP